MKTELMWGVFLGKVRGWESEGRDGWERGGWEGLPASSEEQQEDKAGIGGACLLQGPSAPAYRVGVLHGVHTGVTHSEASWMLTGIYERNFSEEDVGKWCLRHKP